MTQSTPDDDLDAAFAALQTAPETPIALPAKPRLALPTLLQKDGKAMLAFQYLADAGLSVADYGLALSVLTARRGAR